MSVQISFPPFRLDVEGGKLWRGNEAVALRPKTYSVLRYLAERPGRLVTKDELLDAVWPGTYVTDGVLKVCIGELRKALGDSSRKPSFIETLHRRGYRFVPEIEAVAEPRPAPPAAEGGVPMVGRREETAVLERCFARTLEGARQVVFVGGPPSIGKTTLLDALIARVEARREPVWIARGQCAEHYGAGEAFLPVLDVLAHLGRGPAGPHLVGLLRDHAPSWLLQLPGLIGPAERNALRREYAGSGRERMLRELAGGLEAICAVRPLILALEDLQWSDHQTIELLAAIARGRARARLLVVGSLRAADAVTADHPLHDLVRELGTRRLATRLSLGPLDEDAVGLYLRHRFGDAEVARRLRDPIHHRTEGHPLFLVSIVDHLVRDGTVVESESGWRIDRDPEDVAHLTPDSLSDLLSSQLDRLHPTERRTLAAASLMGHAFATQAIAAARDEDLASVETRCAALARRGQFLRALPDRPWPDRTTAARYEFTHALYREALLSESPPAERREIHRRIADRLERGFAGQEDEVATQLALHFELGGDLPRAVRYLHRAGDRATSRHAYRAAIDHLTRALGLLSGIENGRERIETEIVLRVSLGAPLLNLRGFGAPEVEETYARALELCRSSGETPQLFPVLMGLQAYYASAGELPRAHTLSQQVLRLSERVGDRVMRLEANHALGCDLLRMAEPERARRCLQRAIDLTDPADAPDAYRMTGHDPKTCCLCNLAVATHSLGRPDEALRLVLQALAWAEDIHLPFSLAQAHATRAWVHLLRFEPVQARQSCERALELCEEYDLPYWRAMTMLLDAWTLGQLGRLAQGVARADQAWASAQLMGPRVCEPEYRVIRGGLINAAHPSREGLDRLDETMQILDQRAEHSHRAELERQRGELLLGLPEGDPEANAAEAREWLHRSLATARTQGTRHLELKAATALVLHRDRLGEDPEARRRLAAIYALYDEGLDTLDLVVARSLLESYGASPDRAPGGPR